MSAIKKIAEIIGTVPALMAGFKILPSWFKPTGAYASQMTIGAIVVSLFVCVAAWVFYAYAHDSPGTWLPGQRTTTYRRAVGALIAALVDIAVYVVVIKSYRYASDIVTVVQSILWVATFGLVSYALTIFVVLKRSHEIHPAT